MDQQESPSLFRRKVFFNESTNPEGNPPAYFTTFVKPLSRDVVELIDTTFIKERQDEHRKS